MLISHYQHLEREEGEPFGPELVLRGARERLAPILMTALATGLALVPLVVAGEHPGPRDRAPDGGRHPGRAGHLDAAQPLRRPVAVPAVRRRRPGGPVGGGPVGGGAARSPRRGPRTGAHSQRKRRAASASEPDRPGGEHGERGRAAASAGAVDEHRPQPLGERRHRQVSARTARGAAGERRRSGKTTPPATQQDDVDEVGGGEGRLGAQRPGHEQAEPGEGRGAEPPQEQQRRSTPPCGPPAEREPDAADRGDLAAPRPRAPPSVLAASSTAGGARVAREPASTP